MASIKNRLVAISFLILFATAPVQAQTTTGTISGTVKDNSGAVLPSASVELRNVDTGSSRSATTDARGYFTAPNVPLGQYEVTASLSGFQTGVRKGITLNIGQNAVVDFTLQVGAMAEKVEVTAEAPLIETTTATVSGLVNERQVQDLPLNARDLLQLGTLYTGISLPQTAERSASKGFGTKLTISGTRYNQSLFQLDGADINDAANSAGGAAGILMGAETVREFNIITDGFSAEYGRHTGGVFNAVTKSGTNALHGSLFEFLRNEKLDTKNYFDKKDSPIPAYKRNQFGFSLGGPIVHDKTFFFGSYEGLRERLGKTDIYNVPTLAVRQGIVPGQAAPIVVAPGVKPYLDSYPMPNGKISTDGSGEFSDARSLPTNENFFTVRVDHTISGEDTIFSRFTFDDASSAQRSSVNAYTSNDSRNQYLALGETHVFNPNLINQFLFGFTRTISSQANAPIEGMNFPTINFTKREVAMGAMTVPQFSAWGGDSTFPRTSVLNMFQYKDDLFVTKGAHSLKFGFVAQRFRFKYGALFNGGGAYAFNDIAGFLRGTVNSFAALTAQSQGGAYPQQNIIGMYAQDDYHLTPKLTVNLGLRYEFISVPAEKYGRVTNLPDYSAYNQTQANFIFGNPTFLNPSLKNFAPRVGLVWNPSKDGKTSIRAGAGLFHDQITAGPYLFGFYSSPPFVVVGNIQNAGVASFPDAFFSQQQLLSAQANMEGFQYKMKQPTVLKYSFNIQREVLPNTSVEVGFSSTRATHLLRVLLTNARIAQTQGDRLFISSTAPFRSPAFGRLRPRYSDGGSYYNALRLSVTRRLSKGLQLQSSYTYSKVLDDLSNWTGSSDWSNSPGSARYMDLKERALAAFDLRNVWSTNFTYELPGKNLTGIANKLIAGWQVNGILSIQNGAPFTASTGVSPANFRNGFIGDYPDAVAGAKPKYDTRNPDKYFDPAGLFVLPPGYTAATQAQLGGAYIGNAGRDTLTAPGIAKLDTVFTKNTSITERLGLQFRVELFNILDRANFGLPAGRIFANANGASGTISGTVGRITSTNTSARQMQFGLRVTF